jgi:hypothetical protein
MSNHFSHYVLFYFTNNISQVQSNIEINDIHIVLKEISVYVIFRPKINLVSNCY